MSETRKCPVCQTDNPNLQLTCSRCGGYIQDRIASLDLFKTLWMLIESPSEAMKRIILAEQKNYIFLLQILLGCAYVSFIFWVANLGLEIENLQMILVLIIALGPVAGIVVVMVLSLFGTLLLRSLKVQVAYRDMRAIVSYAGFPIIISFVIIFPVEVGLFGMYLFTSDPSPYSFAPVIYTTILGLDALFILWSVYLLGVGLIVVSQRIIPVLVSSVIMIITALLPVIAIYSILTIYRGGV